MTTAVEPSGFERSAQRVDDAVAAVGALEGSAAAAALELKAALEAFHREALVRIVQALRADERGKELLFELVDDPAVHAALAVCGIIRADPMTRAQRALDGVRPYLRSHGGDVELVRIEGAVAYVRLQGACNGCSMAAVTLREGVTEALVDGVSEIASVEVLTDEPTSAFIPLASVGLRDPGWVPGPQVSEIAEGTMVRFDVGDASFVITNIDNSIAAFRNECAHQGRTLDAGLLDAGVLVCPWHGFRFDARTGECLSAPAAQLQAVPTRLDAGRVWVRARGS